MEKPRNGADNSSMREQRLEGLEGDSKFLGPVLSNHQALLMRENGKEDRVRERFREKMKMRGEYKWGEGTNLLTEVTFV